MNTQHTSGRIGNVTLSLTAVLLGALACGPLTGTASGAEAQRVIDLNDTQRVIDSGAAGRLAELSRHYAQQGQVRTITASPLRAAPRIADPRTADPKPVEIEVVGEATASDDNPQSTSSVRHATLVNDMQTRTEAIVAADQPEAAQWAASAKDVVVDGATEAEAPLINMRRSRTSLRLAGDDNHPSNNDTATHIASALPEYDNPRPALPAFPVSGFAPGQQNNDGSATARALVANNQTPATAAWASGYHGQGRANVQAQQPQQYERIVTSGLPIAFGQNAIPAAFGPNVIYRPVTQSRPDYHRPRVYSQPVYGYPGYVYYGNYPQTRVVASTTTLATGGGTFTQTTVYTVPAYPRYGPYYGHHRPPIICQPVAPEQSGISIRVRF